MKNLQIQVGVMETIIFYLLKQQQRARRASYKLLKHKTNDYYMFTLFTQKRKKDIETKVAHLNAVAHTRPSVTGL